MLGKHSKMNLHSSHYAPIALDNVAADKKLVSISTNQLLTADFDSFYFPSFVDKQVEHKKAAMLICMAASIHKTVLKWYLSVMSNDFGSLRQR